MSKPTDFDMVVVVARVLGYQPTIRGVHTGTSKATWNKACDIVDALREIGAVE